MAPCRSRLMQGPKSEREGGIRGTVGFFPSDNEMSEKVSPLVYHPVRESLSVCRCASHAPWATTRNRRLCRLKRPIPRQRLHRRRRPRHRRRVQRPRLRRQRRRPGRQHQRPRMQYQKRRPGRRSWTSVSLSCLRVSRTPDASHSPPWSARSRRCARRTSRSPCPT